MPLVTEPNGIGPDQDDGVGGSVGEVHTELTWMAHE